MRLGLGKAVAHKFLLPVQCLDLQLLQPLWVGFADVLLQAADTLGVLVDDHKHCTSVLRRDTASQFFHGGAEHLNGDRYHLRAGIAVAVRS